MANMSNTSIDLSSVDQISRGDREKKMRYLKQFVELMGERSQAIVEGLKASDLAAIQKIVHSMSPQLKFFEVKGSEQAAVNIQQPDLALTDDLRKEIGDFVTCVQTSIQEVAEIIESNS